MKYILPVQPATWVFRINFTLSKWPHFHMAYLVTVLMHMSVFVLVDLCTTIVSYIACFILRDFNSFSTTNYLFFRIILYTSPEWLYLGQGLLQPGHVSWSKKFKIPFFRDILNFLSVGNSSRSIFFFSSIIKAVSPILIFLLFWLEIHFKRRWI